MYKTFFPDGEPTSYANLVFNVYDMDKNGSIEFNEFLHGLSVTSRGTLEQKLSWAFELYDLDNSGSISKCELNQIVKAIFSMDPTQKNEKPEARVERIFAILDTDRSGELSREEFLDGARNNKDVISALSIYVENT